MAAAIEAIRTRDPARVVAAVPVASPETCEALGKRADEMICLVTPDQMHAVGAWYEDFTQTTDAEVRELLDTAARELAIRSATRVQPAHAPR
jgi:predicted phosphoribosyltransferase